MAVPQEQESGELVIDIESTRTACVGAAAAYLLRKLAARAGCYAPGIQEHLFRALESDRNGHDLPSVQAWFAANSGPLQQQGYRVMARRVAFRTPSICDWVEHGEGFRAAVLPTDGTLLHPDLEIGTSHGVGVIIDSVAGKNEVLACADPWPGVEPITPIPDELEAAHRRRNFAALVLYWSGYS